MYYAVVAIIILLPPCTLGLVDCRVACTRCQQQYEEHPGVLEVYCAMCQECNDRRREQKFRDSTDREQIIYNLDNYDDDCPTPPPCESDMEHVSPYTLAHTIRPTTSSTTTSTTTRRPCPAVTGCKKTRTTRPRCYYPCVPACPCPYPQLYTSEVPRKLAGLSTTGKSTGYLYVYVGVPRDILQKRSQ